MLHPFLVFIAGLIAGTLWGGQLRSALSGLRSKMPAA